jgi:YD repeat-containing protein
MADGLGTETRTYDALGRLLTVTCAQHAYAAAGKVSRRQLAQERPTLSRS